MNWRRLALAIIVPDPLGQIGRPELSIYDRS